MITKVEGIVLGIIDYKENDVISLVMTKEYGLISLVAKGMKKINSKNRQAVMPFIKAKFIFDYKENKTIFNLQTADYIKNFYSNENIEVISALNVIADICKRVVSFDNDYEYIYNELNNALDNIYKYNSYFIVGLFMIKMSDLIGVRAYVDGCVVCNESKVVSFSINNGGFVCHKHAYEFECMSVGQLKKIRMIYKMNWEHLHYLNEICFDLKDFDYIANFFIEHSDINLKSYKFYRSLLSI